MAREKRAAHDGEDHLQPEAILRFVASEVFELKALSWRVDGFAPKVVPS
jgi:hypothetical protein